MKKSTLLLGFLFTVVIYAAVFYSGVIEYYDLKIYDYTYKAAELYDKETQAPVVIIDVDEKSLAALGQWPWSRVILANLVKTIASQKPASIGFDIIFPEHDKTSPKEMLSFYDKYFSTKIKIDGLPDALMDNDKLFAQILKETKTVLPVYLSNKIHPNGRCFIPQNNILPSSSSQKYIEASYMLCNIRELQKEAFSIGFINSQRDADGIFRRTSLFIKYHDRVIPSLGLATLSSVDRLSVADDKISVLGQSFHMGKNAEVLLDFHNTKDYRVLSAVDVLSGHTDLTKLKGKFVLIGTSAVGLHDRYMISASRTIPGVFVHAALIDNIMNDTLKYQPELLKKVSFFVSMLLSFLLVYLLIERDYLKLFILFSSAIVIEYFLGVYYLDRNVYISSGYFLIPFGIYFFIVNVIVIIIDYKDRQKFIQDLVKAHSATLDNMALVAETRDTDTGAHILRTKNYIALLVDHMHTNKMCKDKLTKNFRDLMFRAAPLHDIGKVGIPDKILQKPGKLTEEEFEIMKTHTTLGKNILEHAIEGNEENEFLKIAYNIAYYHHEKWDGSGYPVGLKKEEIPLEARLMAVSDVYDALISKRCYKEGFSYEEAEKIIIEGKGTHFDPVLIDIFIEIKEKFKEIAERITE
ncbi:CHASE2 domain-containing protein [Sulfurimonas sp. HSL-1716]|uniref:CHASE2 domain-containing protein n=1 Tax=Hydrocurvibacter sulfurireducens TaxID=3131937 RepID=UPI0031F88632